MDLAARGWTRSGRPARLRPRRPRRDRWRPATLRHADRLIRVTGLVESSVINPAIGVPIEHGHPPGRRDQLHRRAERSGHALSGAAPTSPGPAPICDEANPLRLLGSGCLCARRVLNVQGLSQGTWDQCNPPGPTGSTTSRWGRPHPDPSRRRPFDGQSGRRERFSQIGHIRGPRRG